MNRIAIHGRITADPEIRYTQSAEPMAVTNFSVAVNRKFKKETADFFRCVAFKKTAELIASHFVKGQEVVVEGSMECDVYEKDGKKFYPWSLKVDSVDFCGTKAENQKQETQKQAPPTDGFYPIDDSIDDSSLPF